MPDTRAHREVSLRVRPAPLDIVINLLGERLPLQPHLLVYSQQIFGDLFACSKTSCNVSGDKLSGKTFADIFCLLH